jgi:histidinol-phosphate aminotransferase
VRRVRESRASLRDLVPYDPKYLPADVMVSANENPEDVGPVIRAEIAERLASVDLNRYPDPLANALRDDIAAVYGLERRNVLVGNGGDELLFDLFCAYGGAGRAFLNMPPTFSVYAANAHLTDTVVVDVPRCDDFSVDVDATVTRLSQGDIDLVVVTSPNNPTGNVAGHAELERILDASDALVLVDEAYAEFSDDTITDLVGTHENLLVLRTFSKAYALAGVRVGYVLGSPAVIDEFCKVRQPYSVDAISQVVARTALAHREDVFATRIAGIRARREELLAGLAALPGVRVWPSDANFLLVRVAGAHEVWQRLYDDHSVLVRDFSQSAYLHDCLRISVGTSEENARVLEALRAVLSVREEE